MVRGGTLLRQRDHGTNHPPQVRAQGVDDCGFTCLGKSACWFVYIHLKLWCSRVSGVALDLFWVVSMTDSAVEW